MFEKNEEENNDLKCVGSIKDHKINLIDDENEQLISKQDRKEKNHLIRILKRLSKDLDRDKNETINNVYEGFLNNDDITKREIKSEVSEIILRFMFYFISPLFAIVNLIGIFQVISIMKSLFILVKNSILLYLGFDIKEGIEVFDFYKYFHNESMNEEIDFNLMLFTGFIGDILLKSRGYRISSVLFWIINAGSLFGFINVGLIIENVPENKSQNVTNSSSVNLLDYYNINGVLNNNSDSNSDEVKNTANYNLFNILYIFLCFCGLYIGIGASALLSQQILVDSHLKYKKLVISWEKQRSIESNMKKEQRIKEKEQRKKERREKKEKRKKEKQLKELVNKDFEEKEEINKDNIDIENKIEIDDKKEDEMLIAENVDLKDIEEVSSNKKEKEEMEEKNKKEIEKKIEENKKRKEKNMIKREKNKFDYFFMICLTTTLGYFGKYSINILLDYILDKYYQNEIYDKYTLFFYSTIGLYTLSIILSFILYTIFVCVFTKNEKTEEKDDEYRIIQICGYTIYTESRVLNHNAPTCECLKLSCETVKNCCTEAVCKNVCCEKGECYCCCCCEYNEEDYDKRKEFFCYCYQGQRKQYWVNKFITNETQKKIVPYMIEYFFLRFTTIAFEKDYNEKITENEKDKDIDKTKDGIIFIIVFVSTFLLFFYFTLSFSRFISGLLDDD